MTPPPMTYRHRDSPNPMSLHDLSARCTRPMRSALTKELT